MELRSVTPLAVLLAVTPFLLALGGGGGAPLSDTIPRPKENFRAELTDRQEVVTRVEHLSCGGRTFFPLERGEGTLMVPFAKVRRVLLDREEGSQVVAKVEVSESETLDGALPQTLLCTGTTEYGNFQVQVRGLSEINFLRP